MKERNFYRVSRYGNETKLRNKNEVSIRCEKIVRHKEYQNKYFLKGVTRII